MAQGGIMKKLTILLISGLMATAMAASAQAGSQKNKRPVVHSNAHAHYKGKDHLFRHGDHDNYNPHHRKCGSMPSGSC